MGQQARARVGDGHERLGGPHRGELVGLPGLLAGALLQHLDHGILLNDLSVQSLDPCREEQITTFLNSCVLRLRPQLSVAMTWTPPMAFREAQRGHRWAYHPEHCLLTAPPQQMMHQTSCTYTNRASLRCPPASGCWKLLPSGMEEALRQGWELWAGHETNRKEKISIYRPGSLHCKNVGENRSVKVITGGWRSDEDALTREEE